MVTTVFNQMHKMFKYALASIILTTTAGHPCIPPRSCPEGQRGHCVANSTLDECVDDACFERKTVPKGHIAVRDELSGSLNLRECTKERYEPTNYHSDKKCGCQLRKSKCSGEGQMISGDGSTTEDTTCICDYTMGYRYSQTPNDICKCRPRKENCNCELEICDAGKILSPDYSCVNKKIMKENEFRCPRIKNKRSSTPDRDIITSVMTNTTGEISCSTCPGNINCLVPNLTPGLLIFIGIAIGVIAVVVIIAILKRDYLKAKLDEFLDRLHFRLEKKYERAHTGELLPDIEELGKDEVTAAPIEVNTSDLEENTQKPTIGNSRAERSNYISTKTPVTYLRVQENEKEHDGIFSEKMYDNAGNGSARLPLFPRDNDEQQGDKIDIHSNN